MKKSQFRHIVKEMINEILNESVEKITITYYKGGIFITPTADSDPKTFGEIKKVLSQILKSKKIPFSIRAIEMNSVWFKGNIDEAVFESVMVAVMKQLRGVNIRKKSNDYYFVK